jgi:hypothetical protein
VGVVCYCVVPMYVGVVIMYAPLTVGSSPCLCSTAVYRSVYVHFHSFLSVLETHSPSSCGTTVTADCWKWKQNTLLSFAIYSEWRSFRGATLGGKMPGGCGVDVAGW